MSSVLQNQDTRCESAPRNTHYIGAPIKRLAPLKIFQYVAPEWCFNIPLVDVVKTDDQRDYSYQVSPFA